MTIFGNDGYLLHLEMTVTCSQRENRYQRMKDHRALPKNLLTPPGKKETICPLSKTMGNKAQLMWPVYRCIIACDKTDAVSSFKFPSSLATFSSSLLFK